MADNMCRLPSHTPAGEKRGNTSWVQCRTCDNWWHATTDLIERETVKLHCPACHDEFVPADAKLIVLA